MNIHEYQAKELFRHFGVPVPEGRLVTSSIEALAAGAELGLPVAVKAQIYAGGRGKGGGVRLARTADELQQAVQKILGMTLVTPQTGPEGKLVRRLLVEKTVGISRELYLSFTVDRVSAAIGIISSASGGMNIEEVAAETPEKIARVAVNPLVGIKGYHCNQAAEALALPPVAGKQFAVLLKKLYRLFVECDCSLLEINPLVLTTDDQLVALDAKINLDDSALFRHADLVALRDPDEEDPLEREAGEHNLNYISLDGTIGNMVNGAGLAMATMDIIKQAGAAPANFLDVGGGANADMVENGFRIILSDPKVKGVLINIFGGILRCDVLATGVVEAAKKVGVSVPVVVRMEGTNAEEGRKILAASGLSLIAAVDLADAAVKVATIATGAAR